MEESTCPDAIFKIVIVGDIGVGKSSFLHQFLSQKFKEEHHPTIGVDYETRTLVMNQKLVKLQIWDTTGQESFRSITRSFYRRSQAVILMYKITEKMSFRSLSGWIEEVAQNTEEDIVIFLVGNMVDLESKRQVCRADAANTVKAHRLEGFLECSAKTGENVYDVVVN